MCYTERMVTTTASLIRTLEDSGLQRTAAEAIASAVEQRPGDQAVRWVLGLLVAINIAATAWLATGIANNAASIADNSERLTRIETLLEERLPPRPGRASP